LWATVANATVAQPLQNASAPVDLKVGLNVVFEDDVERTCTPSYTDGRRSCACQVSERGFHVDRTATVDQPWLPMLTGSRLLTISLLAAVCVSPACSSTPRRPALASSGAASTPDDSRSGRAINADGNQVADGAPSTRDDGRLPRTATPLRYDLSLSIDPTQSTFRGTARIDVTLAEPTRHVVLHGRGLAIKEAFATVAASPALAASKRLATVTQRATAGARGGAIEELVLAFESPLPAGSATIELAYAAPFDDELSGLYRVKENATWYAFTHFEPTDARRAFPCFDEPEFKVPFTMHVTVPKGIRAFANSAEQRRVDDAQTTSFHFEPTKPIPTYLVALAIGDLDVKEVHRAAPPAIRIVTTKGRSEFGSLALEATSGLLDTLTEWTDFPYPFGKLDIVAVPEFAAGAMENPGLITFRDDLLLLDPRRASFSARRSQALVIAHELAHQWFGNLVTAAWWNDLWLNEGFAAWMESRAVDRWKPAFGARLDAAAAHLRVMNVDGLGSARAVRQPVVSSSDAGEAFDAITYTKGAATLTTIEQWIGEKTFQDAIRSYLRTNAFRSVHADALFRELDKASGKNVREMAATYLDSPGVPEVSTNALCNNKRVTGSSRWHVELGQQMWLPLGSNAKLDPSKTWTVPVCVRAAGQASLQCAELAQGAPAIVAGTAPSCPAWVHPNPTGSYYRFTPSDDELMHLARARKQLSVPERVSLLSNMWASVRAGKRSPAMLVRVLPLFDDDNERHVVAEIASILRDASDTLVEPQARPAFRAFVAERMKSRKKAIDWDASGSGSPSTARTPDEQSALMRPDVLGTLGDVADDPEVLKQAEIFAREWLADPARVDSNLALVAVPLASRRGESAHIAALAAAARTAPTREDRILALRAMGGFDSPAVLEQSLAYLLSDAVRPHEVRHVLGAALSRRASRAPTERWIRAHWDELRTKLPGSLSGSLVAGAQAACSSEEIREMNAFYTERAQHIEGAARRLAEALESASLCASLRSHGAAALTEALKPAPTIPRR